MSIGWRKINADVRLQRRRMVAVVLAVVIGSGALATALGARAVLRREIATSFASALPPSIVIYTDRVDDSLLADVRAVAGVIDADSRRVIRARVEVSGEWLPLLLYGVRDFVDMRAARVSAAGGDFPPRDGELLLEQSAVGVLQTRLGSTLHIRVPGRTADIRIGGLVHDAAQAPGWQDHEGYAYASTATLATLGLGSQLDEIRIRSSADRAATLRVADAVAERVRTRGGVVRRVEVLPVKHPHADHMEVVLILLTVFGALALLLAGALTTTVFAFVMTRASGEIATMKTLGATRRQIAWLYGRFVLVIAVPAVVLGMVTGMFLAHGFEDFAGKQLNLVVSDRSVPVGVLALQFVVGLLVPLIASAPHVLRATRVSVRTAMLQQASATPTLAARSSRTRHVARALAWRGMFRRRGRLVATLGALAFGGAALMTAMNVYGGLVATVDRALAKRGDDIEVRLLRPAPAAELQRAIADVPGARNVEVWGATLAAIELDAGAGTDRYAVLAPPADSRHFVAKLIAGRSVDRDSVDDVVVNRALLARERALALNSRVVLTVENRRVPVHIVGIVEELGQPTFYASPSVIESLVGQPLTGGALRIVAPEDAPRVASAVEDLLIERGWFPSQVMTRQTLRKAMTDHFLIMLMLLSSAALAAVIVGALTLATSTSLNVLERSRELAIMRTLGASDSTVRRLLLTENAMLVGLSVLLAATVTLPLTALVQHVIGRHGLFVTVPFVFSPYAVLIWMAISGVVLVLACVIPARRARFAPVQDVLAHE